MDSLKSWKTTITALVAFVAAAGIQFDVINLSADQQAALVLVFLTAIGYFAKDANKTHAPEPNLPESQDA